MKEREKIDKMTLQNNTINAAYIDSSEIVTSKYYEYIALLFTSILLIMLFFRFNKSETQIGGGNKCDSFMIIPFFLLFLFFAAYVVYKKIIY